MSFNIKQWVRSLPVGPKESFVGQVVEFLDRHGEDREYVVRDSNARRWLRKEYELNAIEPVQN